MNQNRGGLGGLMPLLTVFLILGGGAAAQGATVAEWHLDSPDGKELDPSSAAGLGRWICESHGSIARERSQRNNRDLFFLGSLKESMIGTNEEGLERF